jgi:hypothetical protein
MGKPGKAVSPLDEHGLQQRDGKGWTPGKLKVHLLRSVFKWQPEGGIPGCVHAQLQEVSGGVQHHQSANGCQAACGILQQAGEAVIALQPEN